LQGWETVALLWQHTKPWQAGFFSICIQFTQSRLLNDFSHKLVAQSVYLGYLCLPSNGTVPSYIANFSILFTLVVNTGICISDKLGKFENTLLFWKFTFPKFPAIQKWAKNERDTIYSIIFNIVLISSTVMIIAIGTTLNSKTLNQLLNYYYYYPVACVFVLIKGFPIVKMDVPIIGI